MQKIIIILTLLVVGIVSGCTDSHIREYIHNGYESREFSTDISSDEEFSEARSRDIREEEFLRLQDQFVFDRENIIQIREVIPNTQFEYYNEHYSETNPAAESEHNILSRFATGNSIYTLQSQDQNRVDAHYEVYKNDELLVSRPMIYGAESAIEEFVLISINNQVKEGFTFYDYKIISDDELTSARNIRFDGQTMNELYDLDDSSFLFSYNNKIGFVAGKNNKKFIMYDGKQISEAYDDIVTFSCCSIVHYPLQIDHNGIFLFLAKKGNSYPFVEIDLKIL